MLKVLSVDLQARFDTSNPIQRNPADLGPGTAEAELSVAARHGVKTISVIAHFQEEWTGLYKIISNFNDDPSKWLNLVPTVPAQTGETMSEVISNLLQGRLKIDFKLDASAAASHQI